MREGFREVAQAGRGLIQFIVFVMLVFFVLAMTGLAMIVHEVDKFFIQHQDSAHLIAQLTAR